MVNNDVIVTVLLSLHPKSKMRGQKLSAYTKEGLAEMQQYQDLIHMDIHKGYDGHGCRSATLTFLREQNLFLSFLRNWISQV